MSQSKRGVGRGLKIGLFVPGGVDRSGEYRVLPFLLWLIERLARAHEVHVFALHQEDRPCRYSLLGATIHNIGARPRRLRCLAAALAEHRGAHFDVLHAMWAVPGTVAAAAAAMLRRPLLLDLTGADVARLPDIGYGLTLTRRGRAWLRLAVAGAGSVTVPSHHAAQLAAGLGVAAQRLPYGVALDRWPELAPRRRSAGEQARLVHVGSLNRVKDQTTLLRSARHLVDAGVAFHLDIVGADTLNGQMHRLAAELQLEHRVAFHGFLPHAALHPLVGKAQLLLVSSRHETGPLVVLEAAIAGVPTVGTRVGHIADWAPHAAVAVPTGDPLALARATMALLADENRRLALAARAQELARGEDADWTASAVVERYGWMIELASTGRARSGGPT